MKPIMLPICRQASKPLVCQLLMITPSREDWIEVGDKGTARIWLSIKANDTWHTLNHAPRRWLLESWKPIAPRVIVRISRKAMC